jgi:hypothetical protein
MHYTGLWAYLHRKVLCFVRVSRRFLYMNTSTAKGDFLSLWGESPWPPWPPWIRLWVWGYFYPLDMQGFELLTVGLPARNHFVNFKIIFFATRNVWPLQHQQFRHKGGLLRLLQKYRLDLQVYPSCWEPKNTRISSKLQCWATCASSTSKIYLSGRLFCKMIDVVRWPGVISLSYT